MNTATLVDSLLRQLRDRGIRVVYDGDDKMHLEGQTKGITEDANLMAALKAFRPHILARIKATFEEGDDPNPTAAPARPEYETCRVCRAMVNWQEMEKHATVVCNQGGARSSVSRAGFTVTPAAETCPYRQ